MTSRGSLLPIPRPNNKPCDHLHWSGRRCSQKVRKGQDMCGLHKRHLYVDGIPTQECRECDLMREAFPIRRTLDAEVNTP